MALVMDMEEIWKPIKGYEELYQVSNFGRIKRNFREYILFNNLTKRMNKRVVNEKIIKGTINKGYKRICLTKNKKEKNLHVHRLVAQAFIPNPQNKPFINHIDGNKQNNCVTNLEWCDYDENNNHAYENGLRQGAGKISVIQYDLNGKYVNSFESINEASRKTGLDIRHISRNIKGIGIQIGGYKFKVK
jgi:hypothetical protein